MRNKRNSTKMFEILSSHINNNKKEYTVVIILFLIGIIIGIILINHANQAQEEQIKGYINSFISNIKENNNIDKVMLIKQSIKSNIMLAILLWFAGMSVIGMPIVYGTVAFRGFCLSYTVSAIIATVGISKGIILSLSAMFLQSIILFPIVFALAVSGMKLYGSIMKDRRKENIKIEIYRHTMLSAIMCVGLAISSIIEVYISSNLVIFISGWM